MDLYSHPLLKALAPVAEALGARLLLPSEVTEVDFPLFWEDELVGGLRRPDLHKALSHLLLMAEQEIGTSRENMTRLEKQQAVSLLNDWGAFTLRKSVEDVAEALGVSRFTIYNYLEHAESK
ncbi:MAG: helix-turn-helix domain-containing protein [Actinomycetota bacterium]|nr:transcriptional regulator [Acidimicrobiaceae bacterium]MBD35651.1 transcriptional regulator [Actinomycetota bacterium]MEE2647032.1 helix-turn-helix domain-containing protein [Actinomycetota bacterium]